MMRKGFTLVELLVVMAVLSLVGALVVITFTNSLKGSNKSQILSAIKQNGQSVLETMDKTIRNADNVVCYINDPILPSTLVVVKNGVYTRYKFVTPTSSANGYIFQDSPVQPAEKDIKLFINGVCQDPPINPQILTDTNPKTGVSLASVTFQPSAQPGSKLFVSVTLVLTQGKEAPSAVAGQIDPVTFKTTIELR